MPRVAHSGLLHWKLEEGEGGEAEFTLSMSEFLRKALGIDHMVLVPIREGANGTTYKMMGMPERVIGMSLDELVNSDIIPMPVPDREMYDKPIQEFTTKDSGERREFPTGSVRDRGEGKPRYDLIPVEALHRLADLYARGAEKYGERNWEKGQPVSDILASMLRHVYAYAEGEDSEDHLAAVAWNAFAIMYFEELAKKGNVLALEMVTS